MKKEVKRIFRAIVALLIVSVFLLATGCVTNQPQETTSTDNTSKSPDAGGSSTSPAVVDPGPEGAASAAKIQELVVNVGPDPDTIDPALNSSVDGATLIIHGYEGLYSLDKNGIPTPGQAKSVDISDDGTVYTFTLRDGLKWSDGSALTAKDFVYSWQRAINPDTAADYEYMYDIIVGYEDGNLDVVAVNDTTLQVRIIARTPYFLELMAFPVFFPVKESIVEANGDAWATKVETYVGNGPYRMIEWVPGGHIVYEKNPNYWNVSALGPEKIKFVLMDDNNAMLSGFNAGTLSFIDDVPNDEIEALRDKSEFHIMGQIGTYYVSYNVTVPPLDNPKFRQALTLAIDRDFITKNIGKAGQINAGAYVSEGISDSAPGSSFREVGGNYYDPSPEGYAANLALAKQLIKELYPNGNVPTLSYIYNTSTGHKLIAEALQRMWGDIGVNVTLDTQEWSVFLNTRKNGEYQIARNGWLNDYNDPIGMLDMWITGGGNNDAQWSNTTYDSLITQAKQSSDPVARMKLLHQAEDIIFNEWMLAPIYFYVDIFMIDSSLNGFYASPLGYKYFMYTYK